MYNKKVCVRVNARTPCCWY